MKPSNFQPKRTVLRTKLSLTGGESGSEKDISNSARALPDLVGLNTTSTWTKENGAISPEETC